MSERGWVVEPRGEYPPEWRSREIQRRLAARFHHRCEHCGALVDPATNRTLGKPRRDGQENIIAIHHLDGDKSNCAWTNLLYTCQTCHLEVQALWAPGGVLPLKWQARFGGPPPWMTLRGLPYQLHQQLPLL